MATQLRLQRCQQLSGDAYQFSIDSQPHTTIPIPSDQLHDADPSRSHAIQVHYTSDATTGYYFPTYTYTWTTCSSTGSSSESLAYSFA